MYAPLFVSVVAWAAAITISQHVGVYTWLLGVSSSVVVCTIYWFVTVVRVWKDID